MDKELQQLLEKARANGASREQLDDILARYNSKKKEQPEEPFQFGVSDTPSAVQSQEVEEPIAEQDRVESALAFDDAFNPVGRAIKKIPGMAELYSGVENIIGSVFKAGEMAIRENVFAYSTANPGYAAAQNVINSAAPVDNKIADALGYVADTFMEDSRRTLLNKQKDYGLTETQIGDGIVGNLLNREVGAAAKLTASTIAHQIPQLAAMVATGPVAGAALLGTSSAGNKYAEIQNDPTLSSQDKALYSVAIGTAEGLAEYMFRTDVSQFRRAFGKKETLDQFRDALKKELKKETLIKSTLEEGGEELAVGIADLLIEDGLRGNFDNWDADAVLELADAALIGGIMGGGVHSVTRGVNALGSTRNEREIARAKQDINKLNNKKADATEAQKKIIDELIDEKLSELTKVESEDIEFYKKFNSEDLTKVNDLNKNIRKAAAKYNAADSEADKNKYKKEVDDLRSQKEEIENKYSDTPRKYIKDGKEVSRAEFVDMINQATPEELTTGQWGVQNDDEVEQLLISKLPQDDRKEEERVPSAEQEGQAPVKAEPIQEPSPEEAAPSGVVQEVKEVTLSDGTAIKEGAQVVVKNPATGADIQGTVIVEGDVENPRVSIETETDIVELGVANEIAPSDIKPFTEAIKESETLTANEDGTLTYNKEGNPTIPKGTKLTVDADKGLSAVSVFSEGKFVPLTEDADREKGLRVQMRDQDGNEVQLYGQDALDATYNIMLAMNETQAEQLNKLLDNEKTNAAIKAAEDAARKDSESAQETEGAAVEETGERGDPEYVTKKVSELPVEDTSSLEEELAGQFALLTAENPMAQELSEQENEQLNKRAEAWLRKRGYSPRRVSGRYKGIAENSFFVPGLTLEDAIEFAKEFNQDSVAHSEGMVYQDGSMNPRVRAGDNFSFSEFNKDSDFVSIVNTAEGPKTFSVGYDFDTKVSAKKSKTEQLKSAEKGTQKFGEKFGELIDNFNKLLSKLGGEQIPVYVVDGATYNNITGKSSRGTFTKVDGKRAIVVNADKATLGTVYHEMMHAYIASMKLTPRQIVSFVNTIKAELKKGNATEKRLADQLERFQKEYIDREIYGKGLTLDDPNIAEEFAAEFVSQIKDNVDIDKMSISTIDKIRLAVAKFINKTFKVNIDTTPIESRQEAFDFMNGFLDALEGRAAVTPKVNQTANPYQAQRSRLQIEAPAGSKLFNSPLEDATTLARQYMASKGLEYREGKPFNDIDEARAKRISDAFTAMENDPTNPEVAAAYKAMAEETIEQYEFITKAGYKVEINNEEPYNNSGDMISDLRDNKRMKIFSTESGFGDEAITDKQRKENPLLQRTKYKDVNGQPLLVNDLFRFVHDFFGHAKRGNSFGPKGEENAWDVHSRMYTPMARRAMTSETRGQNSYVNFSGVNAEAFKLRDEARKLRREGKLEEANELTGKVYDMMTFAEQKVGLLPDEFVENDYDNPPSLPSVEKGQPVSKEQIDAVNIVSAETPRQKAKLDAVAELLNGFAESQLPPESSEQDLVSRFLNNIFEEASYTLRKGPRESGMTWYIEDITEFESKMKVLLPELNDPNQMKLFKQVLAITSSGTNPNVNLQTAYTLWVRSNGSAVNFAKNWGEDKISFITKKGVAIGTGVIISELKTKYIVQRVDALGNLETFANGKPKLFEAKKSDLKEGYPKPAGFTSRGSIVAQQLEKIEKVFKDVGGDIDKLIAFFENPQPVSTLRKYNDKVPDVEGNVRKIAVGKRNGAFIFGEKIGAFYQNMIGIGDTITMDLWWSRTWNRYMGTMLSTVKGKQVIQETPRTDRERDIMRKAVTLAAKKLNLDVSELQAVIWYFEQELWTKAGNVSPSFSYVTAVDTLNSKLETDEQTQKRFSEAGADLTAAEKRRQDAIARANNIIAEGGIQGAVARQQVDFAGIEMKVEEVPAGTSANIPTGGIAYVPVSKLYDLMDMRSGRKEMYESAEDKKRVAELVETFKKEGFEYKGSDFIYVDIDADGYGWIGEGNHRVLAARQLGMTHLPVRVEFGAARDGKSIYSGRTRVPTQAISKENIDELRKKAGKNYHIKYASIWETDLPTNEQPDPLSRQQIDWQRSEFGKDKVNGTIITRSQLLQQAVQDLLEGKITNAEYQETARIVSQIDPIAKFFLPASNEDMENALGKGKSKKLNIQLEDGEYVGLRLDIPAYVNNNIWVVTAHKGNGAPLTYGSVAWATDVKFGTNPKVAAFIAAGKNMDLVGRYRIDPLEVDGKTVYKFLDTKTGKYYAEKGVDVTKNTYKAADQYVADRLEKQDKSTIGKMLGRWKNFEGKTKEERDAAAIKKVEEIVKIENSFPGSTRKGSPWRQIGMNPFRHSFFYDRRTGQPVVAASEVVQIGGLVYAKDVEYADWSDDQFTVEGYKDADGQTVRFQIDGDAESKVDNEVFKALEKGEIPAPLYEKTWYQKVYSALFRTPLETELIKIEEKKAARVSFTEYKAREISRRIKKYAKTPEALKLANEYLTAEDKKNAAEAIKKLPTGQQLLNNLRVARAFIDNISQELVNNPSFDGLPDDLRFAIQNNVTTYLRTSYRFFTDKNYDIKKRRDPAIQAQFDRLVSQEIGMLGAMGMSELDINAILNERRDDLVQEATQIIDSYISDLQDVKYQPSTSGAGIKMPSAPFRRKKELPDYIKQLLGEEKDPVKRFSQTAQALSNVLYKGKMVNGIIDLVGKNSDYILDEEPQGVKAKQYKKVNDPYSLLDGKWVHNEILNAIDRKPLYSGEGAWQIYFNLVRLSRKSKVIWNFPSSFRKNLTGGWYFILANGIVNPTFYKDFTRRTKLTFSVRGEKFQIDDETKRLIEIMADKGVSGKSVDANLIGFSQATYQFAIDGDEDAYIQRVKKTFNITSKNLKNVDKWLQEKYSSIDDYTKLVIFRSEIESYAKKLYGKNYEQLNDSQKDNVHEQAAERVKQSTPTFSRLPKWFDKIAAVPVVAPFVSFTMESLRSYGANVANAVSDIKKSQETGLEDVQKKEYLKAGLRRLAGSGAAIALRFGIVELFTQWFLDDDDEELAEDAIALRPDWMDGHHIIPRSIDNDGNVRVYNYSTEDPYNDVSKLLSGPGSWGDLLNSFVGPDIAADVIMNIVKNKDIYGKDITDYSDSDIDKTLDLLGYGVKQIAVPPTISSVYRDAWKKSDAPSSEKAINVIKLLGERSVIRDYKYNVIDSFVQDLRKISGTRKTYMDYDNPALRLKQLDDIKNKFNSIVAIALAKGNYDMIDKAERYMKRHLGEFDQDYVLDGIIIKK